MMATSSPRAPTIPQVLLGLLVMWQLVFIPAANVLRLPRLAPLSVVTQPWAEATGQFQGWSLFAPEVPTQSAFTTLELHWSKDRGIEPVRLPAAGFEPADPKHFFRPVGSFRLPIFEHNLTRALWKWDEDRFAQDPAGWKREIAQFLRAEWKPYVAYFHWRLDAFRSEDSHVPPPREMILLVRLYRLPGPCRPRTWEVPIEQPLVRWRAVGTQAYWELPIEMYDPESKSFQPLREKD